MSASTPAKAAKKPHFLVHHAKKPHGILVIGVVLFVLAWLSWNFWLTLSASGQ